MGLKHLYVELYGGRTGMHKATSSQIRMIILRKELRMKFKSISQMLIKWVHVLL